MMRCGIRSDGLRMNVDIVRLKPAKLVFSSGIVGSLDFASAGARHAI